jgi:enterochelin esterase-like enzyme
MPESRPWARRAGVALTTALVALAVTPSGGSATVAGTVGEGSFRSRALAATVHYAVYLPPGYSASRKRYPVIYFLHGLPAGPTAYRSIDWLGRAVEQSGRRAIVIGAEGARTGDSDGEWHDWGSGRNWETAMADELVPTVDARYRTIRSRAGRAIVGVSAGGYGATLIGYHHPATFSVIQSWSGYFEPTNPAGTAVLDLGSRSANTLANMHKLVPTLRSRLGRYYASVDFSFYVGGSDARFVGDNRRLHRELAAHSVPNVLFRVYAGSHTQSLWDSHATAWLSVALAQLAAASPAT